MANVTLSGKGPSTGWVPFGIISGPKGNSKETRNKVIFVASALIASIGVFFYCRYRKRSKLSKSTDASSLATHIQGASHATSPAKEKKVTVSTFSKKGSTVDEPACNVREESKTPPPDCQFKSLAHAENIGGEVRAQQAPSTPEHVRPATPDSAYGDGIVIQGTVTKSSPSRSVYGNGNGKANVPSLNLDREGRL